MTDHGAKPTGPEPLVHLPLDELQTAKGGAQFLLNALKDGPMAAVEGAPQLRLDEVFGRSLHLAGPHDAAVLDCPDFGAAQTDGGFTLSIWVMPDAPQDAATAVSMGGGGGIWALRVDDHAEFHYRNAHEDNGDWRRLVSIDPLTPGRWTHVAVTADAATARMFINGSLVAQDDCPGGLPMGAQDRLRIGDNPAMARDLSALRRTLKSRGSRIVTFAAHRDKMLVVSTGIGGHVIVADARAGDSLTKIGGGGHNAAALELYGANAMALGKGDGIWCEDDIAAAWFDVHVPHQPKAKRLDFKDLSALGTASSWPIHDMAHDGAGVWLVSAGEGAGSFFKAGARAFDQNTREEIACMPFEGTFQTVHDRMRGCFVTAQKGDLTFLSMAADGSGLTDVLGQETIGDEIVAIAVPAAPPPAPATDPTVLGWAAALNDGDIILGGWDRTDDGRGGGGAQDYRNHVLHHPGVSAIAFSRDGRFLASGDDNGIVRIWDVHNGAAWRDAHGDAIEIDYGVPVTSVAFSPNGKQIAVTGKDDYVRTWDLMLLAKNHLPFKGALAALKLYPSALTQDEVELAALEDVPEVQVGTVFPLDFSLHNAHQQQALFLHNDEQSLSLEITNLGAAAIAFPTDADAADEGALTMGPTLELRFRPGVLATCAPRLADPDADALQKLGRPDHSQNWTLRPADDGDTLHLIHTPAPDAAARSLQPGRTNYLTIEGLKVDASRGVQVSPVQLVYRLRAVDGERISGTRLHFLRILQMSDGEMLNRLHSLVRDGEDTAKRLTAADQGRAEMGGAIADINAKLKVVHSFDKAITKFTEDDYFEHGGPLTAGVVGPAQALDDGTSFNTLRIRIAERFSTRPVKAAVAGDAKITLFMIDPTKPEWNLIADGDKITATPVGDHWDAGELTGAPGDVRTIELTRKQDTPLDELAPLDVDLLFKCGRRAGAPAGGMARIAMSYDGIGKRDPHAAKAPTGWLSVDVARGPVRAEADGVSVTGGMTLYDSGMLAFDSGVVAEEPAERIPQSAIIGAAGGLRAASAGAVGLYPGRTAAEARAPVPPPGFAVHAVKPGAGDDKTPPQADAVLDGRMTASGGFDAQHSGVSAASLTVAGVSQFNGDVRPAGGVNGTYLVPKGAIIMWSGKTLPDGWILCDGADGLTPDLRSRFIVGAAPDDNAAAAPGQPHHTPGPLAHGLSPYTLNAPGGQEQVALGLDHLPSHDHGYGKGPVEKGHHHDIPNLSVVSHGADGDSFTVATPDIPPADKVPITNPAKTGIKWDGMIKPQGQNKPHANIPPFHALYFIMKT